MKRNTLTLLCLIGIIAGGVGYVVSQKGDSSGVSTSTPDSLSGIETDSGKRLNTLAQSGTSWGMSPFGSGKPLEERSQSGDIVFKKPNTEWKERTITLNDGRRVTYRFGEGNPEGADPLSEKEKELYRNCFFEPDKPILTCTRYGEEVTGYVTPDVEHDLLTLVSDPHWEDLLNTCSVDIKRGDAARLLPGDMSSQQIALSGALDLENWIYINPDTGRKEISPRVSEIDGWFQRVYYTDTGSISPCMQSHGGGDMLRLLDIIHEKLLRPF